jgi:hypothetical protein
VPGFKNMTKLERRVYLRAYRARKNKQCACGNPASMMKWGEPVCTRCNAMEVRRDLKERLEAGYFLEY